MTDRTWGAAPVIGSLLGAIAGLLLALVTLGGGLGFVLTLEPCPEEDSPNCYWVGEDRGNGEGRSFVNLDGATYYFD